MTKDHRRQATTSSLACLMAALVGLGILADGATTPAAAQGAQMRAQTRVQTNAVSRNIRQALKPKLQVKNGAGAVTAGAIDEEGRYLAIASADQAVRIWDLNVGREIRKFPCAAPILSLAVDSRTLRLIAADKTGGVILWNVAAGSESAQFRGHAKPVRALRLSADGRLLLTGSDDATARLWDVETQRSLATLGGQGGPVSAVAIAADKKLLATGSDDGTVRLWSAPDGAAKATLRGGEGGIRAMAFNADGTVLYVGDAQGNLLSVDPVAGKALGKIKAHDKGVASIQVAPSGTFVTTGADGKVKLWAAGQSKPMREIARPEAGLSDAALTPDGRYLLAGGSDGRTHVWSASTGDTVAQLIATTDGWIVTDAEGRYDGSSQGIADVSWQADQGDFPIDNFAESYFEPGLLAKRMRDPGALLNQNVRAIEAGIALPPLVTIAANDANAAPGTRREVVVTAEDRGGSVASVTLAVNGKVQPASAILRDNTASRDGKTIRTVVYGVTPAGGTTVVTARASNDERSESLPAELTLGQPGGAVGAAAEKRGVLHVAAIGINDYANDEWKLDFSQPDAKAVIDWANSPLIDGFRSVATYELYDRNATRANILERLRKLQDANAEDTIVLFLAGHGVNAGREWFFLPREFNGVVDDESVRRQGLSSAQLRDWVISAKAQRILLLLDTCRSGTLISNFGPDVDRKALTEVGRLSGVHVIAATDREQSAIELGALGHGALTYSLIKGVQGPADNWPRDKQITVRELLLYISDTVPSLTLQYAQHPQFPVAYSRGLDFRIGRPMEK